jgi:hypothetical protein
MNHLIVQAVGLRGDAYQAAYFIASFFSRLREYIFEMLACTALNIRHLPIYAKEV